MSHIPAHAMPHAKAHDDVAAAPSPAPTPPTVPADEAEGGEAPPFPWAAVLGGALAIGGAAAAALLIGRKGDGAKASRKTKRKPAKRAARKPKAPRDA